MLTSIEGLWDTVPDSMDGSEEKGVRVEIKKGDDDKFSGQVVTPGDSFEKVVIKDMVKSGIQYKGGTIHDVKLNKTYVCTMWIVVGKPNELIVRGWVGFFYRDQVWVRATVPGEAAAEAAAVVA